MTAYAQLFGDRYGTPLLADAAYRAGVDPGLPAPGLLPLDLRSKLAGPAVTVEANNDLVAILEAVDHAEPSDVVVITNRTPTVGLMGDPSSLGWHSPGSARRRWRVRSLQGPPWAMSSRLTRSSPNAASTPEQTSGPTWHASTGRSDRG